MYMFRDYKGHGEWGGMLNRAQGAWNSSQGGGVVVPLVWHSGSREAGESLEFQAVQAYRRPLFVCLF